MGPPVEAVGRPADAFKARMRSAVDSPEAQKRLEEILKGTEQVNADTFLAFHKYAAERAYGRLPQIIEGGDEAKPLVFRLVRERKE